VTKESLTLRLTGGRNHAILIALVAILAKEKGLEIADPKAWWHSNEKGIPDLVLIRMEKGTYKKSRTLQYAVEIIDSSDRVPEGGHEGFAATVKIQTPGGFDERTLAEILEYLERHLEGL